MAISGRYNPPRHRLVSALRRTTARSRRPGAVARRSSGKSRRPRTPQPSAPLLTPTQTREVGGVAIVGLGLLCVVSVLGGDAPLLRAIRGVLVGLFGLGWIVPVGCVLGVGALWIWPRPPTLRRAHLLPGAVGVVAALGVLSIVSAPAGGEVGEVVAMLVVGPMGRVGGCLILLLVTLASVIAALRFSLGSALLAMVAAARAAYAERQRLQALVGGRPPGGRRGVGRRAGGGLEAASLEPAGQRLGEARAPAGGDQTERQAHRGDAGHVRGPGSGDRRQLGPVGDPVRAPARCRGAGPSGGRAPERPL